MNYSPHSDKVPPVGRSECPRLVGCKISLPEYVIVRPAEQVRSPPRSKVGRKFLGTLSREDDGQSTLLVTEELILRLFAVNRQTLN